MKENMSIVSVLANWNNKLSFDLAAYLQDREELAGLLRGICQDASNHRNHKGTMAMVNGASGVAAGVVGIVALAAMPTTLGLTAPLAIVGNSMAAASMASSAASYGYSHAVDKDVARRLHNLRCMVETIAKKDDEINVILKSSLKKRRRKKSVDIGKHSQRNEHEDKPEQHQIQEQSIEACQRLQLVCEKLDLAKLAESTDFKSMAIELPVSVLNTQGIVMGTRSIIQGSKQINSEEELEEGLASTADLLDQETNYLRSRECKRRFKHFKSITSQRRGITNKGGRLTYVDGGGGCARKMVVVFDDPHVKEIVTLESDSSNVVRLPEGATNIRVHFIVKGTGGKTVKRVDRSHPKQPWIKTEIVSAKDMSKDTDKDKVNNVVERKQQKTSNLPKQSFITSKSKLGKNTKQVEDESSQSKRNQAWTFLYKEPSAKPTASKTTYETDIFEFRHGDGVDAVFYVEGGFTHSYVSKAWDFGRSRRGRNPPQTWEFWENAEEGCQKLVPEVAERLQQRHVST